MSLNFQTTQRRKDNISSIEPLISAMRTISLSQWRLALNRQSSLDEYLNKLRHARNVLNANAPHSYTQTSKINHSILIILGSNRGLCGTFNKQLVQFIKNEGLNQINYEQIFLVGKQLPPLFKTFNNWETTDLDFPEISMIPSGASLFSIDSMDRIKGSSLTVLFNAYLGASRYKPISQKIYPIQSSEVVETRSEVLETILDTDPLRLHHMIDFMVFNSHLQDCLYASMASEHSARFALMENADQNIENLVTELNILLQDYRKGKITTETQELAVSSGMLIK